MNTGFAFRWCIALLAVTGMQVCCCSLGIGAPCDVAAGVVARADEDREHACCGDPADEGESPAEPCRCATDDPNTVPGEPAKHEMPAPVVVATVSWVEVAWLPADAIADHSRRERSAPLRPPTSLLRQHCALII